MRAEIISIGTEIMLGTTLNTNTKYLTEKLTDSGIDVLYHSSVGDNPNLLKNVIDIALSRADLLIFTGGLGPTIDDLTKEVVSEALKLEMKLDLYIENNIRKYFEKTNRTMPKNNLKQAYKPAGSRFIINEIGTAPGIFIENQDKTLVLLPGPPEEMKLMFNKYVLPLIKQDFFIKRQTINTIGIGESKLEMLLRDLIKNNSNPTIATYASEGQVDIQIVAKGKDEAKVNNLLEGCINEIEALVGQHIYSLNNKKVEEVVFEKLKEKNMKIAFCESCTGGLVSSIFTKIPGISEVFDSGIVTYSNRSKMDYVNVKEETLKKHGAVSRETAIEMAQGILKKTDVDIALSTTGIAGPGGGSKSKPVGLVYIGIATKSNSFAFEYYLRGDRNSIQKKATIKAFSELLKKL